ncbi:TnsA-like heteromeric transposase endonuclease subunit [Nocardia sp. SYP-A9097]|uniref:TnsA-like heteromeric transposase endonuclease subunit n=1 Tax=Nocardia sp. SYP-A9097 TaxID=2663237 RepID=UPI00129AC618|nr:TnsA-like heteromeric transposase endonuclease subunit [Nocardia sp. SYP-A9097]MRH88592.1 TnsA-like heteromeric transposase endonuclease subunit [Nocardia sp. SYP-A9097]
MSSMLSAPAHIPATSVASFGAKFVGPEGYEVRRPLGEAVAFERVRPVRSIPSFQGQGNNPGFYWAATMGEHVEFESWLKRDEAMALDFDAEVIAFAAQPFWLFWPHADRMRSHVPDFFARRADGVGVVIDCRPAEKVRARDEEAFAATVRPGGLVGQNLEDVPAEAAARAREWERHVVEVETGPPLGAEPGTHPRPEYDPATTTVREREAAKAAELSAVGVATSAITVQRMRARYRSDGLRGLIDGRLLRASSATGRADARVVEAIREASNPCPAMFAANKAVAR